MQRNPFLIFVVALLFSASYDLNAEILQVTVTWNSGVCDPKCSNLLGEKFKKMKQVEEVSVNPSSGVAVIKWKPDAQFSYHLIKTNMQMVGVGVNEIRVRVRGKARGQGKNVSLVSLEDNTSFILVSPIMPNPDSLILYPNPYLRELDPKLREKILLEAKEDKVMVIEGPLYQPARSPPLQLVVERIQIEKKKKN